MRSIVFLSLALFLTFSCSFNSEKPMKSVNPDNSEDLIQMSVNLPNLPGRDLVASFSEERRDTHTSLVSLVAESGHSVVGSMFVAEGMYRIAKARKAPYFVLLKEWEGKDGKYYYRVGFADDDTVDIVSFFGDDADKSADPDFMSTSELDFLWGNE